MKHFISLFIFIIGFLYTPLVAQVIQKKDTGVCSVKYITGKPDNYYNPVLANSATFCDSLNKVIGHPIDVITSSVEDSGTVYPVDIHFKLNTQGKVEASKLSPCLKPLELYIENRLPRIINLMNWEPAFYLSKHNKKSKRKPATAEVVLNLRYDYEGIITAIFFNDLHEELFRCETTNEGPSL